MDTNSMSGAATGAEEQRPASRKPLSTMAELSERIARALPDDNRLEILDGVFLTRRSSPSGPIHGVGEPTLCIVAQGSKAMFLGDSRNQYDPAHYLLVTARLPVVFQIVQATPERPFLGVVMHLDLVTVASVMVESGQVPRNSPAARAVQVSRLQDDLLDAVLRLVRLIDRPEETRFMLPLVKREIVYRLLRGDQGDRLREIVLQDGHTSRIAQALYRIRQDLHEPLNAEHIASDLGMSPSSFYQHFRAVTAMSPLQYQKRLRLQEARQLMVSERLDATSAAMRVGYDDASHFTREYRRLFGLPPLRDVQNLREQVLGEGAG